MEIELTRISSEADIYDVYQSVATVLHGPDLFDPNDRENRGRVPNFEIIMGKSDNGKAILRVGSNLGRRLLKWSRDSSDHNIEVKGQPLKIFNLFKSLPLDVKQTLENALYINPERDRLRSQIEEQTRPGVQDVRRAASMRHHSDSPPSAGSVALDFVASIAETLDSYV